MSLDSRQTVLRPTSRPVVTAAGRGIDEARFGGFARDTYWDGHACLDVTHSSQASVEHFQQCAEFPLLRNRGLGPLAVTVLPIALARRAAATSCAAVQSTAPLFRRWWVVNFKHDDARGGGPQPRARRGFVEMLVNPLLRML
jgi:hypothetical protein